MVAVVVAVVAWLRWRMVGRPENVVPLRKAVKGNNRQRSGFQGKRGVSGICRSKSRVRRYSSGVRGGLKALDAAFFSVHFYFTLVLDNNCFIRSIIVVEGSLCAPPPPPFERVVRTLELTVGWTDALLLEEGCEYSSLCCGSRPFGT